ncbi:MAG: hypothetical protein ACRCTE_09660 [Cellulosilyticaceae bacterium]
MGVTFINNHLDRYKEELLKQKEDLRLELAASTYKTTVLLADDLNAVITTEINNIRMKMMQLDKIDEKLKKLETIDSDLIEKKIREKAINTEKIGLYLD